MERMPVSRSRIKSGGLRLLCVITWLVLMTDWCLAQTAGTASPPPVTSRPMTTTAALPLTKERIDALAQEAAASKELDDAAKQSAADLYRSAQEQLQRATESAQAAREFQGKAQPAALQRRVTALKDEEKRLDQIPPGAMPYRGLQSLEDHEQALLTFDRDFAALKTEQEKKEAAAGSQSTRKPDLRQLITDAQTSVRTLTEQINRLKSEPPAGEARALLTAREMELTARRMAAEQQLLAAQQELALLEAEEQLDLPRLERDVFAKKLILAAGQRQVLLDRLQQLRQAAADHVQRQTEAAVTAFPGLEPVVARNRTLATDIARYTRLLETVDDELTQAEALKETVRRSFDDAQTKVREVGTTDALGLLLRRERASLPDATHYQRRSRERRSVMNDTHFQLLTCDDELDQLASPETLIQALPAASDQAAMEAAAGQIFEQQRDLLKNLRKSMDRYFNRLRDLDDSEQALIQTVREYTHFINEHVLWIRSGAVLSMRELTSGSTSGWSVLINPGGWQMLLQTIGDDALRHPAGTLLTGLVLLMLFRMRRRIPQKLESLSAHASLPTCTSMSLSFKAAGLTVLLAAFWPAITKAAGWRLVAAGTGDVLTDALGHSLQTLSVVLFPLELLRHTCRRDGLGIVHLGWPDATCRTLRRHLRWLSALLLPVFMTGLILAYSSSETTLSGPQRVLFIAGMLALAWSIRRVLHPIGGVLETYITHHQKQWVDRCQTLWYPAGLCLPLGLAALSFLGWDYTARHLAWRLLATLWLVLGVVAADGLLLRLMLLRRRRIDHELARKQAETTLAESAVDPSGSGVPVKPPEPLQPDLAQFTEQVRQLLNAVMIALSVAGLWLIWADVLPALRILDQWTLWSVAGEAGAPALPVTIRHVLVALLFGLLTTMAVKSVPSLLELTLLEKLPLDRSARYAVQTLARYGIMVFGLITICGAIHIGWSKVQWLATALTFGLAFGLQEIFANSVAGLIILFERPLRVGDFVTVDGVTGTVSRIRIRATTITNGDRQEFIVPNKEFITGRVLNWTLSDPVNRIQLPVGVAYGSDVEQVRQVLLNVAAQHPNILKDPQPSVVLEQFADSSLNFTLRAFLPALDKRLATIHELNAAIYQALQKHQIEIPFPQRDINLRNIPAELTALMSSRNGSSSPE